MLRSIGACLLAGYALSFVACAASGTGDEPGSVGPPGSGDNGGSGSGSGSGSSQQGQGGTPGSSDPGSSTPVDEAGGGSAEDSGSAPVDDAGGGGTTPAPTLPSFPPITLPEAGSSTSSDGGANMCSTKICVDPVFDCPLQGCFNGCVNFVCQ